MRLQEEETSFGNKKNQEEIRPKFIIGCNMNDQEEKWQSSTSEIHKNSLGYLH